MKCHIRLLVLALGLLVLAASIPAFAQQEQGDTELGLNGSITIPHSSPSDTTGIVDVAYGYYFRQNDLIAGDATVLINKNSFGFGLLPHYRHLFPTGNPKVYPFLGIKPGIFIFHIKGSEGFSGSTDVAFLGEAEAGVRFYLSQRSALDVAYNFDYQSSSFGGGNSFADKSQSVILVGFTHIFGGHHK